MSYVPGDYWVISDISGKKVLRSQCRYDWRGFLMTNEEWSPKHPQIELKGRQDDISVADPRPRQSINWKSGQSPDDAKTSFS